MQIYSNTQQIQKLKQFRQMDHPVALTAPFVYEQRVLIGVYCHNEEHACIDVRIDEFSEIQDSLYNPQSFRLLVHGIKQIWLNHDITDPTIIVNGITDTELMAHMLDSGRDRRHYSLAELAYRYVDFSYNTRAAKIGEQRFPAALYEILADDAKIIWVLASELLSRMDMDQKWHYWTGELHVVSAPNEMTRHGIPVDSPAAALAYKDTLAQITRQVAEISSGGDLNLWDGAAIYELLLNKGVRLPNRSIHRRQRVNQNELKQMAHWDETAIKILKWRDLQADLSFLRQAAGTSRIHPDWNMLTKTSRLTASSPAVQNVNKTTCRPLIRPGPGWVMIRADYKQIQMLLLANFSNDPELVRAFCEGRDVHWETVLMCGIGGADDKQRRDKAKAINFGILFQMTAYGLSRELGTDVKTAQSYIDSFWARYSVAKEYLDRFVENLKQKPPEERIVRSMLDRMRRFDGNFGAAEQRQAKATLLQQAEAETLRITLMMLQGHFRNTGMKSRIVMTIHDAVYVEAPEEEADQAREWIKKIMENGIDLPIVPLDVDID